MLHNKFCLKHCTIWKCPRVWKVFKTNEKSTYSYACFVFFSLHNIIDTNTHKHTETHTRKETWVLLTTTTLLADIWNATTTDRRRVPNWTTRYLLLQMAAAETGKRVHYKNRRVYFYFGTSKRHAGTVSSCDMRCQRVKQPLSCVMQT